MPDQALLADGSVVPLTEEARAAIMERVDSMASDALRCLAFAQKTDLGKLAAYDGDTRHPVSQKPCRVSCCDAMQLPGSRLCSQVPMCCMWWHVVECFSVSCLTGGCQLRSQVHVVLCHPTPPHEGQTWCSE